MSDSGLIIINGLVKGKNLTRRRVLSLRMLKIVE